jgi:hypothetical protein
VKLGFEGAQVVTISGSRMHALEALPSRKPTSKPPTGGDTKEAAMRTLLWPILAIATISATTPLHAQAYDPNYPVCLQSYRLGGGYINCSFTSIPQCQATASGQAAQCLVNPFFAGTDRRRHPAY